MEKKPVNQKIAEDHAYLEALIPFWDRLSDVQKSELAQNVIVDKFSSKQILYSGVSDCYGVFVVTSGRLRVFMQSDQGRELTVFRVNEGEMCALAASCILSSIRIPISIEADENSLILSINSDYFSRLMEENLWVENFMYKIALDKFSDLMSCIEHLMFDSVEKRLCDFLVHDSKNGELKITHEEIAAHIGSAREVVSRMIKKFEKNGWITAKRGYIKILNLQELKNM